MIKGYADKAADVFGNDAAKASAALSDKRQYDNITKNVRKSSEIILQLVLPFAEIPKISGKQGFTHPTQ